MKWRKFLSRKAFLIQNPILHTLLPSVEALELTNFEEKNQNAQRVNINMF